MNAAQYWHRDWYYWHNVRLSPIGGWTGPFWAGKLYPLA